MSEKRALYQKGPFTLYRRRLEVSGNTVPTKAQMQSAARDILTIRDAGAWGIGDLCVYAEQIGKSDPVDEVAEELVRDRQMVRKCYYVSKAVGEDHRDFDLWWNFYFAVYTFPEDVRDRLLTLAVENKWTLDEFKQHLRSLRQQVRREEQKFPEGQFGLLYVDPPWKYDNAGEANINGETKGYQGAAESKYPTMETDEIRNFADGEGRSVTDLAAKNCLMYMWATNAFLEEAIDVGKSWGFEYKTNHVWVKDRQGTGTWMRGRHELLLIFTRGDVVPPDESMRPDSVIQEPISGHSRKPDYVYDMLETLYPKLPKIEIFARSERPGWKSFGNQLPTEADKTPPGDDAPVEAGDEQAARNREGGKRSKGSDPMKPRLVRGKAKADAEAASASV